MHRTAHRLLLHLPGKALYLGSRSQLHERKRLTNEQNVTEQWSLNMRCMERSRLYSPTSLPPTFIAPPPTTGGFLSAGPVAHSRISCTPLLVGNKDSQARRQTPSPSLPSSLIAVTSPWPITMLPSRDARTSGLRTPRLSTLRDRHRRPCHDRVSAHARIDRTDSAALCTADTDGARQLFTQHSVLRC